MPYVGSLRRDRDSSRVWSDETWGGLADYALKAAENKSSEVRQDRIRVSVLEVYGLKHLETCRSKSFWGDSRVRCCLTVRKA